MHLHNNLLFKEKAVWKEMLHSTETLTTMLCQILSSSESPESTHFTTKRSTTKSWMLMTSTLRMYESQYSQLRTQSWKSFDENFKTSQAYILYISVGTPTVCYLIPLTVNSKHDQILVKNIFRNFLFLKLFIFCTWLWRLYIVLNDDINAKLRLR